MKNENKTKWRKKTKIGIFGLTLVDARRNGDLSARSGRGAERRKQKCRTKLAYSVYWGCDAALGFIRGAASRLQLRNREIFGKIQNVEGEKNPKETIALHTPLLQSRVHFVQGPTSRKN